MGVCWHRLPRTERLRLAPCHRWCRTCDSPTHHRDFSSNQRELALGADAGCLVLSWNDSKTTPCLLVRHKHRHINHHAAASLSSFKFVPAPFGVAHDTNATRRPTARITAPPCPSHTRRTRGSAGRDARGRTKRASYFGSSSSRRRRRRGPSWGVLELTTRNIATTRKRSAPPRNATNSELSSSPSRLFGTCLVAFFPLRCDRWPARWARAFFLFGVFQYDLRLGY